MIYDRCRPETMPQANTLFIGRAAGAGLVGQGRRTSVPQIIDSDPSHPLMQWIDLGNVVLAEGDAAGGAAGRQRADRRRCRPAAGNSPARGLRGFSDGVRSVGAARRGGRGLFGQFTTDWPFRASFPVFVLNAIRYFGRGVYGLSEGSVRPGEPVALRAAASEQEMQVRTPDGRRVDLKPVRPGEFSFTGTELLGPYQVEANGQIVQRFVVNLFDPRESDIRPSEHPTLKIGFVEVSAERGWKNARREIWKMLLLAGLVVLLGEWYIYNHRVAL